MYGAGNIGRGFIGQLLSESQYEVVFIDINSEMINKLNSDKKYPITILTGKDKKEVMVSNVRGVIGTDITNIAAEIADADIMATAVGVNVLSRIVKPIAKGLSQRWDNQNFTPLNIIICENLMDADHYLTALIKEELNPEQKILFDNHVGLVEASIGRMVPVMTTEMQEGNILRVCVEEYSELPVDKVAFKGEIPSIKNLKPFTPFKFYIQRKLYIHNMGHAITAYFGKLKGYKYIWEAISDPSIKNPVSKAMRDSARALAIEHNMSIEDILEHVDDLIYRFGNKQLGDTIERVGNDTKRKLSPSDRLVGAALQCCKHTINPEFISLGIAAAMRFDSQQDISLGGAFIMAQNDGPEAVLENLCGIEKDSVLFNSIIEFYNLFDKGYSLDEIVKKV